MNTKGWLVLLLLCVLIGGYFGYEYIKQKPPGFLISLVTKTKEPEPLPQGDLAPLLAASGFRATIFSRSVPQARVLTYDPKGVLVVSQTKEGKVVALPDLNGDGEADQVVPILENLNEPHGLAFRCPSTGNVSADQDACMLYIAETGKVDLYHYDADTYRATFEKTLTTLPTDGGHSTRTLLLHPEGRKLLISVGSSCNVCNEDDVRRASILALDLETNEVTTFATGLRNSVFMAVEPVSRTVWATDNGRDLLGDDIPPDEINIIREGRDYGWPICYGDNIHDNDFDMRVSPQDPCAAKTPSHIALQAHSAALGLAFIPEEGWPEEMQGDVLVAYHGSWNRSVPTGYKVVRFDLDAAGNVSSGPHDFLTGFLPEGSDDTDDAIGRPVGLLVEPGGVVFVSDDRAGAVYRVHRTEN